MKTIKLIKTRFAQTGIETATAYLTAKNSIYITLVAFGALLSPFTNLLYYGSTEKGIFGFTYMSSFLFAIGYPLMAFFFGLLLRIAAKQIESEIKTVFKIVSRAIIFTACFYIYWAIMPMNELPAWQYYTIGIICAIVSGKVSLLAHRFFMDAEEKLKSGIRRLFKFIITDSVPFINPESFDEYCTSYEKVIDEIV